MRKQGKSSLYCMHTKSLQSCLTLCDPMDWLYVAHHAPLSWNFSRQEYWNESPFPPPEDLPNPGIEPRTPTHVFCTAGRFFHHWICREALRLSPWLYKLFFSIFWVFFIGSTQAWNGYTFLVNWSCYHCMGDLTPHQCFNFSLKVYFVWY